MKKLEFKRTKTGSKLCKTKTINKKGIEEINKFLDEIPFEEFLEEISPYIIKVKKNSFTTYLMTYDDISALLFCSSNTIIESRFSIISGIETDAMNVPDVFRDK